MMFFTHGVQNNEFKIKVETTKDISMLINEFSNNTVNNLDEKQYRTTVQVLVKPKIKEFCITFNITIFINICIFFNILTIF